MAIARIDFDCADRVSATPQMLASSTAEYGKWGDRACVVVP